MQPEGWMKICKNMNEPEGLPEPFLMKIYENIKKYEIQAYRDLGAMQGISYKNFLMLTSDTELAHLSYYDEDIHVLDDQGFEVYAKNLLENIISEK